MEESKPGEFYHFRDFILGLEYFPKRFSTDATH
jgi:hypothetical protein